MTRLLVNARADEDVDAIFTSISASAGVPVAVEYDEAFRDFVLRLGVFPRSGSPRPELGPDVRIGIVKPYILIYRYDVDDDAVELLRVVHGHRNLSPRLLPR